MMLKTADRNVCLCMWREDSVHGLNPTYSYLISSPDSSRAETNSKGRIWQKSISSRLWLVNKIARLLPESCMSRNVSSRFEFKNKAMRRKWFQELKIVAGFVPRKQSEGFFIFSTSGKAVNLSFLCTIIAKVKVSENDGLPGVLCRNCYNQIVNLRNKLGEFKSRSQAAQQN